MTTERLYHSIEAKESDKINELLNYARNWKRVLLTRKESQLLKTIVNHFSEKGRAPSWTYMRRRMNNFSVRELRLMLKHLAREGTVTVSKHGKITGALGFSSEPTNHTVNFASGPSVNVWCALDAIGIPAAQRRSATIVSSCPQCGSKVEVTLKNGSAELCKPESSVLFTILPWMKSNNVREDVCPYINLFCSDEHLETWRSKNAKVDGARLTVPQASLVAKSFFEELV